MAKVAGALLASAAGWIGSFMESLVEMAEEAGMTLEDVHRLVTPQGKAVLRRMVAAMVAVMKEAWGLPIYDIIVDYSQTLEQMVAVVGCDSVNRNISSSNKDFTKEIITKKGIREELKVVLLHLDRVATSQEVLAEMERLGLRPATLAELLALGAKHPELQREFPIIALGSSCTLYGYRRVASLWSYVSWRRLGLDYFDARWPEYCRFLAVSK